VGVKIPETIPPMRMTGASSGRIPRFKAVTITPKGARAFALKPLKGAMATSRTIMAMPMMTPGTKPAIKSLATDSPARAPKMTMGMLGGMMGPMVAEVAVMAALKSRS
jgi:hypothetical protein